MAKNRSAKRQLHAESDNARVIKQKQVDINFKIPEDQGLLYADQFSIQFYADEFVIGFFQTEHPLVFSEQDFAKRNKLDARCVARFVLNPNHMGRFVLAINQNFARWQEVHMPREDEKE
jgi:hypothetical protein